jgi:hypothetical protein
VLARPFQPPLVAALALKLTRPRAGLPAGTLVLVGFTARSNTAPRKPARPATAGPRQPEAPARQPLTVTPQLGLRGYVFPIAGGGDVADTYGAGRSDVPGGWHHGDDLFAPLGTPVLAVANGSLNRVGWQRLGGWRLWVRDRLGNEFYYAHLSGYTPLALHSKRVHAGDVLGFVGITGDAIGTPPHLHFEIHPRPLLHLDYDGAVDPTTYLGTWTPKTPKEIPLPVHPVAPDAVAADQTRLVFRQLLQARGLLHTLGPAKQKSKPAEPVPAPAPLPTPPAEPPEAAPVASQPGAAIEPAPDSGPSSFFGALALLPFAALAGTVVRRRRRDDGESAPAVAAPAEADDPAPASAAPQPTAAVSAHAPEPERRRVPTPVAVAAGGAIMLLVLALVAAARR